MLSFDTWQFSDYSRYDAAQIDAGHKAQVHADQFPKDLQQTYLPGKRLTEQAMG